MYVSGSGFWKKGTRSYVGFQDKKLEGLFDTIITNPAEWREDGLLVVRRRIEREGPQHSCRVGCSPNMCKGEELEAFLKDKDPFEKMIYVGDGSNDFCPILRLREYVSLFALPYFVTSAH